MTDLFVNAPAPQVVEPDEDETGDEIVFVRNGWVRITIAGVLYKLRRPFLGELRDLEATMDHGNEELRRLADKMRDVEHSEQALADANAAEARELDRPPELTDKDWRVILKLSDRDREELAALHSRQLATRRNQLNEANTALMLRLQERLREVTRTDRQLREGWWAQAFKLLTPPGHPEPPQMPSWVGNAVLQNQIIQHWQSNPLALGDG